MLLDLIITNGRGRASVVFATPWRSSGMTMVTSAQSNTQPVFTLKSSYFIAYIKIKNRENVKDTKKVQIAHDTKWQLTYNVL